MVVPIPPKFSDTGRDVNTTRHRKFACTLLLDTQERFLFQLRDDIPGVIQRGKIGLFGGHRDDGETCLACIVREIREEIGLFVPPERFELLAAYDGMDIDVGTGTMEGKYFLVRDIPVERLVITEGALFIAEKSELAELEPRMGPSVKHALGLLARK